MNLISVICFCIGFIVLLFSFRKGADSFAPGRIFAFVWSVALGITNLKLSRLQHVWSAEVWINMLLGPLSFILGLTFVYILFLDKKVRPIYFFRRNYDEYFIDGARLYKTIIVLFVLFLVAYGSILAKSGEIPLFSPNPGKARANFTMFGIGMFLHNVVLIVFFTALYFVIEKKNRPQKIILVLVSLVAVIMYGITLQRFQIFMTIFLVLILLYYTTYRIKTRTLVITLIVVVAFFYSVTLFRLGDLVLVIIYKMSKMKYSHEYAVFTEPYMYFAMNLENYARAIAKTEYFTFGYYTFDFLTALTGIKHWVEEYFLLNETPFLISDYNTFSGFFFYYRDFGTVGVFLIPLFGGLGIGSLYYSFRTNPTIQKIGLYGMLLFGLIFTFFNSVFGYLWFVYNFVALLVVFRYISIQKFRQLTVPVD
jgi:oligosaccharide repeat unit polymerase